MKFFCIKLTQSFIVIGNQNDEIKIKQEQFEDDEQECYDYTHSTFNGSNDLLDVTTVKEEIKTESSNEPCTENVYMVLPQIKDEIKKENSRDNSLPFPDVCNIWLDSTQEDQYYPENCKAEPEEDDSLQEDGLPDSMQEYFPDIMPHFLIEGTESDQLLQPRVVSCHKCGEVCSLETFMEHNQLRHKYNYKTKPTRARKSKKRKNVRKYVYPCPYCGKCLPNISQLKIHILTHTQERPHKCPFCDYQGNQPIHVDCHIETKHLNIRRFKCELCDYSASTLGCLKKHKRTHHIRKQEEPRQCPYCDVVTLKLISMQNHIKKKHKKK
ncbi:unnamed protein product [Nezara viridula]|uniref:C2H2-type domain-containing protein n=1 Tax=Nezara viridula TaxID=85310 RepID=A0A9P0MXE1_NEZVI|nr:unnamed protein product [Nezara viridula]